MNIVGSFSLTLAWFLSGFALVAGLIGAYKNNSSLIESARLAAIGCFLSATCSISVLAYCFLTDDYQNHYVWQFSNRDMHPIYKFTAIWGGMNGSMLLWAYLLTVCGGVLAWTHMNYPSRLITWALPSHMAAPLFFLTMTAFFTNPFQYIKADFIPPDGNGLNPLLQNPYMAVHPPLLYLGFITFAVPFAFCIGALLSNRLTNEWVQVTRKWTLIAWGFLTAGIVLGGYWAYIELGWGGFWAWDPVENSSFLPWLTGTAYLHSVIVQERKGMLKMWNVTLIALTYGLTVFGTFLTRSGIVQSVHAFASTDIGEVFLIYLAILFVVTAYLLWKRRVELRPEKKIESILSREAAFLLNNLIFLSICFATLWGVMFPVLSEAVTGAKQTIGIPFFNAVNIPLFLIMIFMMGVGSLIAWKRATIASIRKTFLAPFISSLFVACILVWAGIVSFYPVLSYSLCFFVLMTIMGEFHRGIRAQRNSSGAAQGILSATSTLFRRHTQRYGGYVVHFGVLIMTVSITASMAHKVEKEFSLAKGERYEIGRFSLTLDTFYGTKNKNYEALVGELTLRRLNDEHVFKVLKPEMRFYPRKSETTSEVALRVGPREDVYIILAGLSEDETRASFKIFINPLQMWLWIGTIVVLVGTGIVLLPEFSKRPRFASLARDLEVKRAKLLQALKDLDLDYATQKISSEDYLAQKNSLSTELGVVYAGIDDARGN